MRSRFGCMLLLALIGLYFQSDAQIKFNKIHQETQHIKQYQLAEWVVDFTADFTNPYDQQQVQLNMLLTDPRGLPLYLPCFFDPLDQGGTWKARFTPQSSGTYHYQFQVVNGKEALSSADATFSVTAGNGKGFIHSHDLWTFQYDDGSLFRGVGENIAWESRSFEDDKWTYDYLLPKLAENGGNFFRTWMCYWNLPLEWKKVRSTKRYQNSESYFNEGGIRRMDQLVRMCDSLHLHFMLAMDWHGHLMDKGGWKNSNYNIANGGPAKTPSDFFTMQKAQEQYKNRLRYIVARWGYSPSIAVWEFFNEVDNAVFTQQDSLLIKPVDVTQWHQEMSRYLKDIDPYKHLVSTSISHRDILGMNSIAYIDFNQKHIYKHTEKIPAIYPAYIQTFGKPYVVGEFGYRWEDQDPKYATEAVFDYKRGLWYGLFSPTPILPMSWWWELFDNQNMMPYLKGVRMISERMLQAGKGQFEPLTVDAGNVQAFGMRCGDEYYVYLLNNTAQHQDLRIKVDLPKKTQLELFSTKDHSFTKSSFEQSAGGVISLPQHTIRGKEEALLIFSPAR